MNVRFWASDHDFAVWAFGDAWYDFLVLEKDSIDLLKAWNELHGDLYFANEDDMIMDSMEQMKRIWKKEIEVNNGEVNKDREGNARKARRRRKGA